MTDISELMEWVPAFSSYEITSHIILGVIFLVLALLFWLIARTADKMRKETDDEIRELAIDVVYLIFILISTIMAMALLFQIYRLVQWGFFPEASMLKTFLKG